MSAVACITVALASYLSPLYTFSSLQTALNSGDTETINKLVDFASLKESLKAEFLSNLVASSRDEAKQKPMTSIGLVFQSAIVSAMVDACVTPAGLASLCRGQLPNANHLTEMPHEKAAAVSSIVETSYESPDRYSARIVNQKNKASYSEFLLSRTGWFSWRLSGIRISDGAKRELAEQQESERLEQKQQQQRAQEAKQKILERSPKFAYGGMSIKDTYFNGYDTVCITPLLICRNESERSIAAFRGTIAFFNLFGENIASFEVEETKVLGPGQSRQIAPSFELDAVNPEWCKFARLGVDQTIAKWIPKEIIFSDGGRESNDEAVSFQLPTKKASTAQVKPIPRAPYIGIDIRDKRLKQDGLLRDRGVVVINLDNNGPGAAAGLKKGDIILTCGSDQIASSAQLMNKAKDWRPNQSQLISIWRNGDVIDLTLSVGSKEK